MRFGRRALAGAGIAAVTAGSAAAALGASPAYAAAEPGQALNNDYGQSDYERSVEIKAQVAANPTVKSAKATYATLHASYLTWVKTTATRYTAYKAALTSGSSSRIASTKAAYLSAKAKRDSVKKSQDAAYSAVLAAVKKYTTYYTGKHYRPVDGTYTGALTQYFIPSEGLEPVQVQITVYGGHVSDIAVTQRSASERSKYYIDLALPTLMVEAMNSGDTAKIATVTTATLTSDAFRTSLTSALLKAGYKF